MNKKICMLILYYKDKWIEIGYLVLLYNNILMKKFLSLSLLTCSILLLTGCGSKVSDANAHGAANTTTTPVVAAWYFLDDTNDTTKTLLATVTVLWPIGQVNVSQWHNKKVYAIKIRAGSDPITITALSLKNMWFVNSNEIWGFTLWNGTTALSTSSFMIGTGQTNQTITFPFLDIVIPGALAAGTGGYIRLTVTADITPSEVIGHTLRLWLSSINITDDLTANNIYLQGNTPQVNPLNYTLWTMYFN